ncbi:LysE family translocator [Chelatococcus asaccharovorans]|uniref:LysE family translocator n=1 Tax=Chelatococcus asaccharovorans TaxID=28210 RepID=UPI00224C79A8|nr:LysE family translocator [Chelatococcus asaccharovorans]CAH1669274.1 L-lysine permease [Chelatococcus asaccharovorans]CAH1679280.1 L-lysine permease [Chelatococcus asaccharovorans]
MHLDQLNDLMLVYVAYFVAVASPGPSNMAILGVALGHGRRSAVALALGIMTGSLFWACLAAAGISTILARYSGALFLIKMAGGFYLLYLACKSARSAVATQARETKAGLPVKRTTLYRRGVLLHVTNPKSILGWIAIMSLGLRPDAPPYTFQAILAGCTLIGLSVFVGYALAFSTALMGRIYARSRRWIEGTLAMVFGYAGIRLLLSKT